MTTIDEFKRRLEKKYQQLNPEERARVASSGFWKIADTFAEGKDITEQQWEYDRFIRNYVDTLPVYQFSDYLENLSKCDTTEWGKRYFSAYINGLIRENALIEICLIHIDMRWKNEIFCINNKANDKDPGRTATRERLIKDINFLRERKREIAKEIDEIFNSDFWDIRGIERPARPDINPEQPDTEYEMAPEG